MFCFNQAVEKTKTGIYFKTKFEVLKWRNSSNDHRRWIISLSRCENYEKLQQKILAAIVALIVSIYSEQKANFSHIEAYVRIMTIVKGKWLEHITKYLTKMMPLTDEKNESYANKHSATYAKKNLVMMTKFNKKLKMTVNTEENADVLHIVFVIKIQNTKRNSCGITYWVKLWLPFQHKRVSRRI